MTTPELRATEAFALVSGLFRSCQMVSDFIRTKVRPHIHDNGLVDGASQIQFGQLLRVDAWLGTIGKLSEPADFQAVASACRSLLETAIDIVLIHADPSSHARLLAWEESARLKQAEGIDRYFNDIGSAVPDWHQPATDFIVTHKIRIDQSRMANGWTRPNGRPHHPDRWTARNLGEDAKEADRHGHTFQFRRFYETEYRQVCWMVHGSGFILRSVSADIFPAASGMLFPACMDLALLSSELVLRHIGAWNHEREADFADCKRQRVIVTALTLRQTLGLPPFPERAGPPSG